MSDLAYIWLPKDKDYIYCFKRESVMEQQYCDYYEHNLECDKNNDFWGRTHSKHTCAGYTYANVAGSVLNSCDYCIKNAEEYKKYWLPQEAKVNKEVGFLDKLLRLI